MSLICPRQNIVSDIFLAIGQNAMEVGEVAGEKKRRLRVLPTVTETLRAILADAPALE